MLHPVDLYRLWLNVRNFIGCLWMYAGFPLWCDDFQGDYCLDMKFLVFLTAWRDCLCPWHFFKYTPRKVTWQWKIHRLKMYFLWTLGIFQCHVSFQGVQSSWNRNISIFTKPPHLRNWGLGKTIRCEATTARVWLLAPSCLWDGHQTNSSATCYHTPLQLVVYWCVLGLLVQKEYGIFWPHRWYYMTMTIKWFSPQNLPIHCTINTPDFIDPP